MYKHLTHQLAFIVGSALSISILAPRTANAQERVARLMMLPASDGGAAALAALQSDESNVLVAQDVAETLPLPHQFAPFQDCDALRSTLAANFDLSVDDPRIVELADALCAALTNAVFYEQQAMHVRRGGAESLSVLLEGPAPTGAVAVSGPDGDVLVLGNFLIYQINSTNDSACDLLGYCGTWAVTANPDQAHLSVGLAIGRFTR